MIKGEWPYSPGFAYRLGIIIDENFFHSLSDLYCLINYKVSLVHLFHLYFALIFFFSDRLPLPLPHPQIHALPRFVSGEAETSRDITPWMPLLSGFQWGSAMGALSRWVCGKREKQGH